MQFASTYIYRDSYIFTFGNPQRKTKQNFSMNTDSQQKGRRRKKEVCSRSDNGTSTHSDMLRSASEFSEL